MVTHISYYSTDTPKHHNMKLMSTESSLGTCLLLGGYCLSDVRGDAAGLKVGDVNPFINPVLGKGVTWINKTKNKHEKHETLQMDFCFGILGIPGCLPIDRGVNSILCLKITAV